MKFAEGKGVEFDDRRSLAYYNVPEGAHLELAVKKKQK